MNSTAHADGRRWSYAAAAGLVLAAWAGLALWSGSPYAEWLDHARMEHLPAPLPVRLAVFALGWTLMVVAMMLPGTLLLLARGRQQPLPLRRLPPILLPYLGVWLLFGLFCSVGDGRLHEVVEHSPALAGMIAPATLLLAGVYQFTPFKRFSLPACDVFAAELDGAPAPRQSRWALGLRHALALMLLMFALGGVNLLWMLALGVVMAAEQLAPPAWGLSGLLGGLLVVAAVLALILPA